MYGGAPLILYCAVVLIQTFAFGVPSVLLIERANDESVEL